MILLCRDMSVTSSSYVKSLLEFHVITKAASLELVLFA